MLSPIHQSILRELNSSLSALDEDAAVMVLCNGKLPNDEDFYAFVNIKAAKLVGFYDAVREGKDVKLSDYGEVIASGDGLEPPADVRKKMEEEYNLDYGLGEKLRFLFQA